MANWGKRTQLRQGGTWIWRPKNQNNYTQLPQHEHDHHRSNVPSYETKQQRQPHKGDVTYWTNNWKPKSYYENTTQYQYGHANKSVPLWEKEFCASMGVAWKKLETIKRDMDCFPQIVKWDSSAAQEAFEDGKRRYWAKIKGLPCDDVPLPDPDAWIDDVDWDCTVDHELVIEAELEREKRPSSDCTSGWRNEWGN